MALKATKEVKFRVQQIDFRAYQIIRIQELPGTSPPGPPPGFCPGPARGLTQPSWTPAYFPLILQFAVGSPVLWIHIIVLKYLINYICICKIKSDTSTPNISFRKKPNMYLHQPRIPRGDSAHYIDPRDNWLEKLWICHRKSIRSVI